MDSHVTWTKDPDTGAVMPEFDRAVTSEPLRKYIKGVITNGVLPNPSNNLQVSAGTNGMTVLVNAGFCVIEGGLAIEPETRTLEVTSADSTYDRIDTVVARWDSNDAVRRVDLHIKAGVPASHPVRPTLTRNESIYELGLADVFVTKGVATITNEKITDTRMESARCGICSSISKWDTTTIYQQVQADLKQFKSSEQTAFMEWFDQMKDQLSEDAAGHLQAEIDETNTNLATTNSNLANTTTTANNTTTQITIADNIENDDTATHAHAAGSYIQWKGKFYVVTAAIATGDTLAVGTNLTPKAVGEVLTQINSDLSSALGSISNLISLTSGLTAKGIGNISELDKRFMIFTCTSWVPITSSVNMPNYTKGIFVTTADSTSTDGVLLAVDYEGALYVAFRSGSRWDSAKKL